MRLHRAIHSFCQTIYQSKKTAIKGNQVTLVGYVGQNLKTGNSSEGTRRVGIRLATHSMIKTKDGTKENKTTWHDVVVWGSTATFAEKTFVRGSRILVEGSIEYRNYLDQSGHRRYITQIKGNSLMNLDR